MASSPKESQESSQTQPAQPQPSRRPRLPSQWRLTQIPKLSRIPPASSRIVSPPPSPPPPIISTPSTRSYVSVLSEWCLDNGVGSLFPYLSSNPLLRKMFSRRIHHQCAGSNENEQLDPGVEVLGPPVDYWLTFPLQPPGTQVSPSPPLPCGHAALSEGQEITTACVIGPVKCSKHTLEYPPGTGPQPAVVLAFPWVTNASGTKSLSIQDMLSRKIRKIIGHVECRKCGTIVGLGYLLPERSSLVMNYVLTMIDEIAVDGEEILQSADYFCGCDNETDPASPIISDDLRRINWLFLFLGYGLGHCNSDQLRYFCTKRELPTGGTKNDLLLRVVLDLCKQLDPVLCSRVGM